MSATAALNGGLMDSSARSLATRPPRVILVVGGGAAGFFAAIAAAEALSGQGRVILCEATAHLLAKVRISGGGRCNVTHACFDTRELARRYPRGHRELPSVFSRFGPADTIAWFAARGVELKTEEDGRMFPVTDDSATVVHCLTEAARRAGVEIRLRGGLRTAEAANEQGAQGFRVQLSDLQEPLWVDRLILAMGGLKASPSPSVAETLGHTVEAPVPSLFTFHVEDPRLRELSGLSVSEVATRVSGLGPDGRTELNEHGPLLITHWGLSGPAILKLSAWGARWLAGADYRFTLSVNFSPRHHEEAARARLADFRAQHPRRQLTTGGPFDLPLRLWEKLVAAAGGTAGQVWSQASNERLQRLARQVVAAEFAVTGKSLHKEEFVTCGGVRLKEVDLRTLESRRCPGLFLAGEMLDIDGVTGGFNFQAAWSTGWLAGRAAAGV